MNSMAGYTRYNMRVRDGRSDAMVRWGIGFSIAGTSLVWYCYHRYILSRQVAKWQQERQAERTGRIRAEIRLRSALKAKPSTSTSGMTLSRIGTVHSPYTKRMGTPRQGSLVPSSRGIIKMCVPMEALDGLAEYSHMWIIFEFHANTDLAGSGKTKIRPPRGGGIKVGQLATRSPHRPNPLGLSLVTVEGINKERKEVHISAFDLVNGTPIYDLKPFTPFDMPNPDCIRVPKWVSQNDALSQVLYSPVALEDLKRMLTSQRLAPFYVDQDRDFEVAKATVAEVLAQDPRASHKRGTSSAIPYNLVFGRVIVEFGVSKTVVQVLRLKPLDYDSKEFVDGIPLTLGVSNTTD